jgi:hypothetical protein
VQGKEVFKSLTSDDTLVKLENLNFDDPSDPTFFSLNLPKVMIALDERRDGDLADMELVGKLANELGVEINENAKKEAGPAIAIWLFDGSVEELPGGYDKGELSPNSPVKELKSFPQDLVLVGRSSILIKGISSRLGIPWSLAKEWAPIAREVLQGHSEPRGAASELDGRVRFREVWKAFKLWSKGKATKVLRNLPDPVQRRFVSVILKVEESRTRRKLTKRDAK